MTGVPSMASRLRTFTLLTLDRINLDPVDPDRVGAVAASEC